MKNINGTNYISAKEYAAIKDISEARVSQLKSELPFEKMEDLGVSLINFDLLQLTEKESSFAQAQFQTTQPIHTYNYLQLGLFLADMIKTGNEARANAEVIVREKDELLAKKEEILQKTLLKNQELEHELVVLKTENEALQDSLQKTTQELAVEKTSHQDLKVTFEVLTTQKQETDKELTDLKVVQQKTQSDYEVKVVENQGLTNENSYLKGQIESLSKELEAERAFKDRFEKLENFVMQSFEKSKK